MPQSSQTVAIIRLLRAGKHSYSEIAALFDLTRQRVGAIARRAGIQRRNGP